MFNYRLKRGNYLFNVAVLMLIFTLLGVAPLLSLAIAVPVGFVTGTLMNFVKSGAGLAYMAVQKEVWEEHIEEAIFKDNAFIRFSFNADEYVSGRAVHIPQSGGAGNVVKNRAFQQGGATVRKRVDTDVLYLIDEFTTDPVHIGNAEEVELSYHKRESVLGEDKNALLQTIAEEMLYNWTHDQNTNAVLPTTSMLKTTGQVIQVAEPDGTTGYRLAATLLDQQRIATFLRTQNRWFEGLMYGLYTANMHAQTFPADSIVTATLMASATEEERRSGLMGKSNGLSLMQRSNVITVSKTGAIKAPGAVPEVGDCEASFFWYKDSVEAANGEMKMFDQYGNPVYYGDLFSFLKRVGGRCRRADWKGLVLLVQGTPTAAQITKYKTDNGIA